MIYVFSVCKTHCERISLVLEDNRTTSIGTERITKRKTFTFEYKLSDLLHLLVISEENTLYSLVPFDRLFVICSSRLVAGRVGETVFEVQVGYERICIITQQVTERF